MYTEQLTVQQAKDQGYEFYGHSGDQWVLMIDLDEFDPAHAKGTECLFCKDCEGPFQATAEQIKEILADKLSDEWDEETGDDTGEMLDFINEIPVDKFDQITAIINEAMAKKHRYMLTKIKLLP